MLSESAISDISSDVGFGFPMKLFSKATLMVVSMLVRFFLRRPRPSLDPPPGESGEVVRDMASASCSHFSSKGLSLHMFLKLKLRASKREMVV